jgi:hypothetical protein
VDGLTASDDRACQDRRPRLSPNPPRRLAPRGRLSGHRRQTSQAGPPSRAMPLPPPQDVPPASRLAGGGGTALPRGARIPGHPRLRRRSPFRRRNGCRSSSGNKTRATPVWTRRGQSSARSWALYNSLNAEVATYRQPRQRTASFAMRRGRTSKTTRQLRSGRADSCADINAGIVDEGANKGPVADVERPSTEAWDHRARTVKR